MSTDPELPRASPPPTPPPIQTKPSQTADASEIQPPENDDEEECKTPTAPENRIPEPLTCPPAPRKPRKEEFSCKRRRKKYDLEFFEAVNREEVESFFGASYESLGFNSSPILKRKIS